MNLSIKLDTPCEFINVVPFNPLISKCQIKVCWVGDEPNRNRSVITKEVATEMANSLPGSPIVGFYNEANGDYEEHNRIIDISNGQFKIKDTTKPYGFVDLNAKCWFQKFDDDGVEHEYLMTEGWLWTGQYPEAQRILEHGNNQSMELDEKLIDAHWTKDDNGKPQFFIINEAIISKLCILGEEFEPCFEGAQITKVQFSFEDGFKDQLFSMMKELKEMMNGGGTPVFTQYAVEIGDALWCALHEYLVAHYPDEECEFCSRYRVEGIYEEENSQKFAILHDIPNGNYFRIDLTASEEGYTFSEELIPVEKEFVPVSETPQFEPEAYSAYIDEYVASKKPEEEEEEEEEEKCPKCGKPLDECDCEDEEEEDKKDKYTLEEIPEYMQLSNEYAELETKYNALEQEKADLVSAKAALESELEALTQFKMKVEREQKKAMIHDTFYMLSEDLTKEVMDNIDNYSLEDIESKLSVICVRNKVSFTKEGDNEPEQDPYNYNLGSLGDADESVPAWIKAALKKQNSM